MYRVGAFLADRLPVPVISPGPLTYRYAEIMVDLKLTESNSKNTVSPGALSEMVAALQAKREASQD